MFVDHSSINRWAIRFLPLLEKVFRKHKRPVGSRTALKAMRQAIRRWKIQLKSEKSLEDISYMVRSILQGWQNYYGCFYGSAMRAVWGHFNQYLANG